MDNFKTIYRILKALAAMVYNPEGHVQIYIRSASKGRDISRYNTGEQEVLYERNSIFRVCEKDFVDGIWSIVMVEGN